MRTVDDLPLVDPDSPMSEIVVTMAEKAPGVAILSREGERGGLITDGDLRRNAARLWEVTPREVATREPVRVDPEMLVKDAMELRTRWS